MGFIYEGGDWTRYRALDAVIECDFHRADSPREIPYWEVMTAVEAETLMALRYAQAKGYQHVLFTHGSSTSYGWKQTTARSVVRGVMRSKASTAYVHKNRSIQHETVFVAAIKPGSADPPEGIGEYVQKIGPMHPKVPIITFAD